MRKVVGKSMLPVLRPKNFAIFLKRKSIKVNDIVLAKVGGREVVKRVSSIQNSKIYLLGDNADDSTDSREYGAIDSNLVKAKLIFPRA